MRRFSCCCSKPAASFGGFDLDRERKDLFSDLWVMLEGIMQLDHAPADQPTAVASAIPTTSPPPFPKVQCVNIDLMSHQNDVEWELPCIAAANATLPPKSICTLFRTLIITYIITMLYSRSIERRDLTSFCYSYLFSVNLSKEHWSLERKAQEVFCRSIHSRDSKKWY